MSYCQTCDRCNGDGYVECYDCEGAGDQHCGENECLTCKRQEKAYEQA